MCSFGISSRKGLMQVNEYAKRRGPDLTTHKIINNFEIIHNLLHITGELTPQPFISKNCSCVYNGEIYNYNNFGSFKSDGECILPLYEKLGYEFAKALDGEFAIIILDFNKNVIVTATDCFGTKPLWFSLEDDLGFASLKTQLTRLNYKNVFKQKYNTTHVFDINTKKLINTLHNVKFDLTQQKTSFKDWQAAFKNSIAKRANAKDLFTGLSSGFDSGMIALELTNQNIDYTAFSLIEGEDLEIIKQRSKLIKEHIEITVNPSLKKFFNSLENDEYNFKSNNTSFGIFNVFARAKLLNKKVFLTGHGADEIISDYGYAGRKIYEQSTTGGVFPEKLETIFPWSNFFEGTQQEYISKEESIASFFGIESRYPFLDIKLVQEFLWLTSELKNKHYKGCMQNYLKIHNFPFKMEKIGWPAAPCPL